MPISAGQIVEVNPILINPSGSDLEFNGLLLSQSNEIPSQSILSFSDPTDITDYFGYDSIESRLGEIYFLGYKNAYSSPRILYISHRSQNAIPAWIRGGKLNITLGELKTYIDVSLEVTLSGITHNLEGLNFSSITSFSDAAQLIQSALNVFEEEAFSATNVSYSSRHNSFKIVSGSIGTVSTIDYCAGEMATALSLSSDLGATLSQGIDSISESAYMDSLISKTQNWVNFTTAWMPSAEEVLGYSRWASSKKIAYLYLYSDNDERLLDLNSQETIAYAIKEENLSNVAGQYAGVEYSVFLMSVAACIDWNQINSTITTAFKSQDALPATVENSSDASQLISVGMNFVGDYATRNDNFIFNYPGQMFGDYKWIDIYWNAIWLNNALQVSLMQGLTSSPRTPYSENGYALIRAWLHDPINRALRNGAIEAGVVLSDAQKTQINREVGKNIAHEIYSSGYYIQIEDPGAEARAKRESPIVKLWYTYGGSVNSLKLSSAAVV